MKSSILIVSIGIIAIFTIYDDQIYAQEQTIDEFLEWPSETNYNFVLIAIVIIIVLAVMANFLWSKRSGRRYSEE